MECCKWEELGLLYTSDELDRKDAVDFEEHLKECEECRKELYYYRSEKKQFFAIHILGDAPSPEVDAKILHLCSNVRKKGMFFSFMPAFLRKAAIPVALFALAFISAGYVMLNMDFANQFKSAAIKGPVPSAVGAQPAQPVVQSAAVQPSSDSTADSLKSLKENYAKSRGNLQGQGVVPVDLINK
jgi:anti-sigma factor RsiW